MTKRAPGIATPSRGHATRLSRCARGVWRVAAGGAMALAMGGALIAGGCRGDRSDKPPRQFLPDMDDSPKWKPQSPSEFYADGRTMRQPVKGTVPFGRVDFVPVSSVGAPGAWAEPWITERKDLLKEDVAFYQGVDGAKRPDDPQGNFLDVIPVPVTRELITRGMERFNIYCAACHGYNGEGGGGEADGQPYGGMAGRRWLTPVPGYHDPKYLDRAQKTGKDGYIFSTALHGVAGADGFPLPTDDEATRLKKLGAQKMPPYSHALSERDAWAVVAYIRVLQAAKTGSMEEAPAELRPALQQQAAKLIAADDARKAAEAEAKARIEAEAARKRRRPAPPGATGQPAGATGQPAPTGLTSGTGSPPAGGPR